MQRPSYKDVAKIIFDTTLNPAERHKHLSALCMSFIKDKNYTRAKIWLYYGTKNIQPKAWYYHNLSIIKHLDNKPLSSLKYAEKSLSLDPNNKLYLSNLLKLLVMSGLHDKIQERIHDINLDELSISKIKLIKAIIYSGDLVCATALINKYFQPNETDRVLLEVQVLEANTNFNSATKKLKNSYFNNNDIKLLLRLIQTDAASIDKHSAIVSLTSQLGNDQNDFTIRDIHFGLFQLYDQVEEYENAFNHLSAGNAICDNKVSITVNERIINFLKYKSLLNGSCSTRPDATVSPIFILGLPRSGTSLVEQILSNMKNVKLLGESSRASLIMSEFSNEEFSRSKFREEYLNGFGCLSGRFIDKMPINFDFLPVLMLSFPEAKFILTQRKVEEQIFGVFQKQFTLANYYCFNLKKIAEYKAFYDIQASDFRDSYPNQVYLFDLDKFNQNPNQIISELANFLNIDCTTQLLDYTKNRRQVNTMSANQVLSKNYVPSAKWKEYWPMISSILNES